MDVLLSALGTVPGDANLDGRVDASDLNQVGLFWQQSGSHIGWGQGNFNCDNRVDALDLNELGIHWQFGAAVAARPPRAPLAAAVSTPPAVLVDQVLAERVAATTSVDTSSNDTMFSADTNTDLTRIRGRRRDDRIARRSPSRTVDGQADEQLKDEVLERM
jgi:hypothetical protein